MTRAITPNPILPSVERTYEQVASRRIATDQGAGMAYQSVAQSTAFAVRDATDYLRSVSLVGTTAIAAATARMIEEPNSGVWKEVIDNTQAAIENAVRVYKDVGCLSGQILRHYPPAESGEPYGFDAAASSASGAPPEHPSSANPESPNPSPADSPRSSATPPAPPPAPSHSHPTPLPKGPFDEPRQEP